MNRDAIINDLIRNRPKGPKGSSLTYEVENKYCYDSGRYKNFVTPSCIYHGYDTGVLFDLGFKQKSECELYIRNRDFEGHSDWNLGGKKATLTRRVNRLWDRISNAVNQVVREGGRGIYKVKSSMYSSSVVGHLYAETKEEAAITAKIYFGYLSEDQNRMRVEFVRRGSVSEMKALNEEMVKDLDEQIVRCENEMNNYQKRITNLKARKETLATVEAQQTAVEMVNTLSAMEG